MARLTDLDDWIDGLIRNLKEVYYETDPCKGEEGEIAKHELAQMAIENFWYLHGRLLSWATAHMTGYCILKENPKLSSFMEKELDIRLTEDSHILEQIGLTFNFNPPDRDDHILEQVANLLEKFNAENPGDEELILTPTVLRDLTFELLMSRCADNSYWRFELQSSMRALNEGEVDDFARAASGRHQGLPASLNRWKLEALRQVRFRVGKGIKKYRALAEVGEAIGQSPEALRSWEKSLEKSHDRAVDLYCSELAGQYDAYFRGEEVRQAPSKEDYGSHRGVNHLDHAKMNHGSILRIELQEIRERIRCFRSAK